ncbi:GAF domain-containing protein [Nonomuraea soli]|uniref:GAF domain-containing protein n=1 Tax=Nonomuraea soli TaxID=1032476 RepID=A0A7W0CF29_9ACTN|nr:GAF domain-containing protein [Nonomuraea soli]MBA2890008.1 GAF domain-containing protein [Nonomuraea soli]
MAGSFGLFELRYANDRATHLLADLEAVIGDAPGPTVLRERRPVLVPDLCAGDAHARWPGFVERAAELGIRSLFAFPIGQGGTLTGVLEINRTRPGALSEPETEDALLFAEVALVVAAPEAARKARAGLREVTWSALVYQAGGMVSVQLGIPVTEALARLRAHAFASGRTLTEVSGDVVNRRLRLHA